MADRFSHALRLGNGIDLSPGNGDDGKIIVLETPDIELNVIDGDGEDEEPESKHSDNLVDDIDRGTLATMATVLLRGIQIDDQSRSEWLETRAKGIALLGLRIKPPRSDGGDVSAPVEGISTYDDPLLLEAVIRGAANALGELCPTDGPVKIRNDNLDTSNATDWLADALEREFNHFLTVTATEYYPETDRVLFLAYFGGTSFKKVYSDPIRNRPVSEGIDAVDLIVSNDVTDLRNAARITHVIKMDPATFRRMQNLGVYSDVPLLAPQTPMPNSAEQAKRDISGVKVDASLEDQDRERDLYECYCKYEIPGFESKDKLLKGVPLPWRVTIDKASQEIISVVRNWDEDDAQCLPKDVFVDYTYIRGFGFYGIGLLHVLGNTTNGLSASIREIIDAGMFASFPGFLYALDGPEGKQLRNIFRIPPGGGKGIQTGGRPLNEMVSPIPYKDASPGLMAIAEAIRQNGQRLGGTAEIEVGEGRQDAPVGTTLALLEQAAKPMDAVHKRLYQAQARELRLLVDLFRDDPEALWRHNKRPTLDWTAEILRQALDDYDLTPMADPNTSSHMQRVARTSALVQLALASPPGLFNAYEVAKKAIIDLKLGNATVLLNANFTGAPSGKDADPSKMVSAQAQMLASQAKLADAQSEQRIQELESADVHKQENTKQAVAQMNMQKELILARTKLAGEAQQDARKHQSDAILQSQQLRANSVENRRKLAMDALQKSADRTHQGVLHQTPKPAPTPPPFGSMPS